MKDKYPTLQLMGINNPDQIQSYSLTNPDPRKDVLRIDGRSAHSCRRRASANSTGPHPRQTLRQLATASLRAKIEKLGAHS